MIQLNQQINQIADNAIQIMADNQKVGYEEFLYCSNRIKQEKTRAFKLIAVAESSSDINIIKQTYEAKVGFLKAYAVGKTKLNRATTEEITEE